MKKTLLLMLLILLTSCIVQTTVTPTSMLKPTVSPPPTKTEIQPTTTPEPEPSPTEEGPSRTNWLILGGDFKAHRQGTKYGNKTDVIILVSVLETDPVQVTMIQYPRNLYIEIPEMDNQWLFAVWGREGWEGLHYYWQQAFDVDLNGIFYINMDGFVKLIDDLGGLQMNSPEHWRDQNRIMNGEEVLAYLRDNLNQWGYGTYDREERTLRVMQSISHKVENLITDDFFGLAQVLFTRWHGLVKTDITEIGQLAYLVSIGWQAKTNGYDVKTVQLEEPEIVRGDTPLEVRGMIPSTDLSEWHRSVKEVR